MDEADIAQPTIDRMLAAQLAAQVGKSRRQGPSRETCLECGEPIPERRRDSLPGVTHCAACAGWIERRNKR